jgi:hypothetical protein
VTRMQRSYLWVGIVFVVQLLLLYAFQRAFA